MADTTPKDRKVWKSSKSSEAAAVVGNDDVILVSKDNSISVNQQGITISGPISLVSDARNIRTGGLFVGLDDFLNMIPSTIVTPYPKQIPFPPVHGVVAIGRDVAFFMALLG